MAPISRRSGARARRRRIILALCLVPAPLAAGPRDPGRRLPLAFEENRGQAGPHGQFVARGGDWTLLLDGSTQVVRAASTYTSVRVRWLGANPRVAPVGTRALDARVNYYVGDDPRAWLVGVPTWDAIGYHDLYPGVDAIFSARDGQLEYDLHLAPGADPGVLRLAFDGVDRLQVDHGDLVVRTGRATLRYGRPVVYQETRGHRVPVSGRWRLLGGRRAGFVVGRHDRRLPLVVDPVLAFGTYLGGSLDDRLAGIGVDDVGNVYVVGTTLSTDFPTVPSMPHPTPPSKLAFVSKLDPTGSTLLSSVVFGGLTTDSEVSGTVNGAAVDGAGNVFLTGFTPGGLPTANAAQSTSGGNLDAFVVKVDTSGVLSFSTYLGGGGYDIALGVLTVTAYVGQLLRAVIGHAAAPEQAADCLIPLRVVVAGQNRGELVVHVETVFQIHDLGTQGLNQGGVGSFAKKFQHAGRAGGSVRVDAGQLDQGTQGACLVADGGRQRRGEALRQDGPVQQELEGLAIQ